MTPRRGAVRWPICWGADQEEGEGTTQGRFKTCPLLPTKQFGDRTLLQPLKSYAHESLNVGVRESIPRQVDKKSGGPQGREGSRILKEEERTNFFSSTFLRIM